MLVLNEKDMRSAASLDDIMQAIEKAFQLYVSNDFFMPHRFHVDNGTKTLLYMPCMTKGGLGTKYLTLFPDNIPKGLPTIYGLMILNDIETGEPLCILDGKALTALRTGAVGATGIKYTTPENASSIGLIGAGVQGYYQLLYATQVRPISSIYIYDNFSKKLPEYMESIKAFVKEGTKVIAVKSVEELLEKSEIVITATTSNEPVLPNNAALLKGKSYIGVGSYKPTMREFPPAICEVVDHLFIDIDLAKEETGDLAQPLKEGILTDDRVLCFGEFITKGKNIDAVRQGTTFFKTVGMALFDVVVGQAMYEKALANKTGQSVIL